MESGHALCPLRLHRSLEGAGGETSSDLDSSLSNLIQIREATHACELLAHAMVPPEGIFCLLYTSDAADD